MKYRKLADVEARQVPPLSPGWHEHDQLSLDELADWCGGQTLTSVSRGDYIVVPALDTRAWGSDWIVQHAGGQFEKVEHADFAANYRPVRRAPVPPEVAAQRLAEAKAVLAEFRREDDDFLMDITRGPQPNYSLWAGRLATRLSDLIATLEEQT